MKEELSTDSIDDVWIDANFHYIYSWIICQNIYDVRLSDAKSCLQRLSPDDVKSLSFPKHGIRTKRYKNIIVKSADVDCQYYFSGAESAKNAKGTWETAKKHDTEQRLLEAICVQHEIDHLNGITIHDREKKLEPTMVERKIGRNQLVTIKRNDAVKVLKYKKAQKFINQGWIIE